MQRLLDEQPNPLVPSPNPYGQIPIHRVDAEPRSLTAAELERFKHLIPRDSQRQHTQHAHSRRDNLAARFRGSARFRAALATQAHIVRGSASVGIQQNSSTGSTVPRENPPPGQVSVSFSRISPDTPARSAIPPSPGEIATSRNETPVSRSERRVRDGVVCPITGRNSVVTRVFDRTYTASTIPRPWIDPTVAPSRVTPFVPHPRTGLTVQPPTGNSSL